MKPKLTKSIVDTLSQGIELLESLSQEEYTQPQPLVYNATVGGHYRHLLEHYSMLLQSYPHGEVDYDLRSRNPQIEQCRQTALETTKSIIARWSAQPPSAFDLPIQTRGKLSHHSEDSMDTASSVGREVAYSNAHAQHHFALIGVICKLMDREVAHNFGVAPSTAKFLAKQDSPNLTST